MKLPCAKPCPPLPRSVPFHCTVAPSASALAWIEPASLAAAETSMVDPACCAMLPPVLVAVSAPPQESRDTS